MVSFVGAGPGAEDLITVRGMRLLEKADVIIYAGSLVSDSLLSWAKEDCQIYNSARMSLDEVIAVIKAAAEKEQNIVRLHTGDPSVYGAIREQMDHLEELGIAYEVVPGVSSFCGAAAALKAEYTLPNVSQSVIITRMEGRTKVPELEKLSELSKHRATMVIFLSASMTDLVSQELIKGGYEADTPAAIVYKATWPEEKVLRCTVGTLNQCAKENHITNHALITVGYFLGKDYELSKLYDAGFSTGFRDASRKETLKVSFIAFSDKGKKLAKEIADGLIAEQNVEITDIYRCQEGGLNAWSAKHFRQDDALIYVGACGIATRAIAPYINHKTVDPAVIVVDELGKNVIPLLSGHIGGANRLSEVIAKRLGTNASITTATDINGVWSIDTWATDMGMTIQNPEYIKVVSSKLLAGKNIVIESCIKLEGTEGLEETEETKGRNGLPKQVTMKENANDSSDVLITYNKVNADQLVLIPRVLSLGIGCKKGTRLEDIQALWEEIAGLHNLDTRAVKQMNSIDIKADEKAIIEFADYLGVKLKTYSAEALNSLEGTYSESKFVRSVAGVDCVCERSAVMGAKAYDDSSLIVRKTAKNGVTIAVAVSGFCRV